MISFMQNILLYIITFLPLVAGVVAIISFILYVYFAGKKSPYKDTFFTVGAISLILCVLVICGVYLMGIV